VSRPSEALLEEARREERRSDRLKIFVGADSRRRQDL